MGEIKDYEHDMSIWIFLLYLKEQDRLKHAVNWYKIEEGKEKNTKKNSI